jgi:hypothetical protein
MRALWKILTLFADIKAVSKGPNATAKRVGRKVSHQRINRWLK